MSYHKVVQCDRCGASVRFTKQEDDYSRGYRSFSFVDRAESRYFNLCPLCMSDLYKWLEKIDFERKEGEHE